MPYGCSLFNDLFQHIEGAQLIDDLIHMLLGLAYRKKRNR